MPRLRPPPEPKAKIENSSAGVMNPAVVADAVKDEAVEEVVEVQSEAEIAEPEPQPSAEETAKKEADSALQKQLEAIKKSEEINKRLQKERDEAVRQAQERALEVNKFRKEAVQGEVERIGSALRAAQAELDKAQQDFEIADANSDSKGRSDATRRMIRADRDIADLEAGKAQIEIQLKEPERLQPSQHDDPIDALGYPEITRNFLKSHRDWLASPKKVNKMRVFSDEAEDAGFQPNTQPFLDYIASKMEAALAPQQAQQPQAPQQRTNIVSAPVSRDIPSGDGKRQSGKVTLTKEEVEAARMSGISVEDYAKNKQLYQQMRANGQYGDHR